MAPLVRMTIPLKRCPHDRFLQDPLIANLNLYDDSDRHCPVARDGARSHLELEKVSISSQPDARNSLDPGRSVDPDIGLS